MGNFISKCNNKLFAIVVTTLVTSGNFKKAVSVKIFTMDMQRIYLRRMLTQSSLMDGYDRFSPTIF